MVYGTGACGSWAEEGLSLLQGCFGFVVLGPLWKVNSVPHRNAELPWYRAGLMRVARGC